MKRLVYGALFFAVLGAIAWAQSFTMPPPAGVVVNGCVSNAASPVPTAGAPYFVQCDAAGALKVAATVNASIHGFDPNGNYATVTATNVSADVALPTGAVVTATNTGTTAVSCQLSVGAGVAVASQNVIQPGSTQAFEVGTSTHAACIDQTGAASNVVVFSGGTGLPTGWGGGGGGGGTVTQGPAGASAWLVTGTGGTFPATQSGNWTARVVGNAGGVIDAVTGAAVPANAFYPGMNSSGNLVGMVGDTTSGLWVNIKGGSLGNITLGSVTIASVTSPSVIQVSNATSAFHTTVDNVNANGQATMANSSPVVIASNQSAVPVAPQAQTTGGCTPGVVLTAVTSTNATSIKGSAGTLCEFTIISLITSMVDVRLYDTASVPTCSSATGVVANYPIQNTTSQITFGVTVSMGPFGKAFSNGIGFCATGANANNDNTNATGSVNINYSYK